jgi:hypothetical protein
LTVNSGGTLNLGSSIVAGSGALTLSSGATLVSAHASGLNGNIMMTGIKTLDVGANYTFNGTSIQATGLLMPTTVNNLTSANAIGVMLSQATTVNGILTFQSGWLDNSTPHTITLGPSGSVVSAGGTLFVPLPVEMTSFTAVMQGSSALLKWTTATETNNAGFQIERSVVGSSIWADVAFVNGVGTSNSPISYLYEDKNLYNGGYVYRIKQIDNIGGGTEYFYANADIGASKGFQLCGNYPNPFNPSTNMQFSVPATGYASLKAYNMLGQEVVTLFSGTAKAGHYISATFNASRLASGIYFARLQYNGKSLVQRMLLTK